MSFRMYSLISTVLVLIQVHNNVGEYKQWIPNTNWNTPSNWATGKSPCPQHNVLLGNPISTAPLAVALTGYTILQSLSLPLNGELIFNKNAELIFFQDKEVVIDKCAEKGDIQFIASTPKQWYNPAYWNVVDSDGNSVANQANAVLHLEQVPCQHDQLVFPEGSSFLISNNQPITVATLKINGQTYSQSTFQEYLKTVSGSMQFKLSNVHLTGEPCTDLRGCVCNTHQIVRDEVCGYVTCDEPQCAGPLHPNGSCCAVCGLIWKVKMSTSFRLSDFKELITKLMTKFVQSRTLVQVSMSRLDDMFVQVVFTDLTQGIEAQHLSQQIGEEISESPHFTIVTKQQSGHVKPSNRKSGHNGSNSLALALGLGISVLVVIILVIAVFAYRRKSRFSGYSSTRHRHGNEDRIRSHSLISVDENNVELQEIPDVSKNEQVQQHEQTKHKNLESDNLLHEGPVKRTFDNPLYESASQENLPRDTKQDL